MLSLSCHFLQAQTYGFAGLPCDSLQKIMDRIFEQDLTEQPATREIAPALLEFTGRKECPGLTDAMNLMGIIHYDKGENVEAKEILLQADSILRVRSAPSRTYVRNQLYLGLVSQVENNMEGAMLYFDKSVRFSRRIGFKKGELQAYLNLGAAFINNNELEKAVQYLQQAIDLREALGKQVLIGYAYFNLARIEVIRKNHDRALELIQQAEQIWQNPPFPKGLYYNSLQIANIHRDLGRQEERISYLEKAVEYAEQDSSVAPYYTFLELGYHHLSEQDAAAAEYYFRKALAGGENFDDDNLIPMVGNLLDLYAARQDVAGIKRINANLLNIYRAKAESSRIEAEKWQQKELILENREEQLKRRNQLLLLLGLLSAGIIYIAFAKYRESKVRKQLLEKIEQQHQVVKEKNQAILEAQDQLIVQEKLASLGNLTAGIAHEIKNPLNFIINFAEDSRELSEEVLELVAARKDQLGESGYQELAALLKEFEANSVDIRHNGQSIDRIVRSMMDHARGKDPDWQMVDLNELLNENANLAYHSFRASDPAFSVDIQKHYASSLPPVRALPQHLSRVILNILTNACYAVNQKQKDRPGDYDPVITLSTQVLKNAFEIRIRDNGPGIPPEIRKEIFTPFFTTKPTGLGNTGLGLSISYDIIVKEHNGSLDVESEPGTFTEFIIRLPNNGIRHVNRD